MSESAPSTGPSGPEGSAGSERVASGPGMGAGFDLAVAAASLQSDQHEVGFMLELLANQLADPLGERLRVERKGGLFKKSSEVRNLRLEMGPDTYEARIERGALACTIAKTSGGIRIRSEAVTVDTWLKRILQALQEEAQHSSRARAALENIVMGGGS